MKITGRLRKPLSMRKRNAIMGYLFILPFIIGVLLFIVWPIISSLCMSFSSVNLSSGGHGFSMDFIGLENYRKALLIDPDYNRMMIDSAKKMLINTPCIIIFSIIIAVLLNRKFPGRTIIRAIFFIPVILTSGAILSMDKSNVLLQGAMELQHASADTSITTTLQELLLGSFSSNWRLVNFILSIINGIYDIVISSSIQTIIFLSALQSISPSIYEAAKCEGCSQWELFWKITLPMISPMILVAWIYTIIDSFMRSDNAVMMKVMNTITSTLDYGYSAAMAWMYCLFALAFIGLSSLIISRMVYYYD